MNNSTTEQISAGTQETVDTAKRLGLTWTLRPGTVATPSPLTVTYDGDTVPIGMVSMVGDLVTGDRVYCIAVPPAGNFIIGRVAALGPVARVDSSTSSGAIAGETVVLTTPTVNFQVGHIYRIGWRGQTVSSVANTTTYRVRLTSSTGTLLNVFTFEFPAADSDTFSDSFYLAVATATSDVVVLTLQASAGTTTMAANTTNVRFLEVIDMGSAVQYPNALAI